MPAITLTINKAPRVENTNVEEWMKPHYIERTLETATGVHIENIGGEPGPMDVTPEFLLLLASGDYPDIMFANWLNFPGGPNAALNEGYIMPLNDAIDKYAPNFKKFLEDNPDWKREVTTDEGIFYSFPCLLDEQATRNTGLQIRKDWLDKLNMPVPETIDEWYQVLTRFKNECGATSPLTFEYRWLFLEHAGASLSSPWGVCYPFYVVDGKVKFGPMEPGYRDFLATMSKWYAEGLIDYDMPSINKATVEAKFSSGETGIAILQAANLENVGRAHADNPDFVIAPLYTPVLKKGDPRNFGHYQIKFGSNQQYGINPNTKNLEAICRYFDYSFTPEGHRHINFGIEGVSYEVDENGNVVITEAVTKNPSLVAEAARKYFAVSAHYPMLYDQNTGHFPQFVQDSKVVWADNNMEAHSLGAIVHTSEEADFVSRHYADVDTYCREMVVKYIIGSENLNSYDSFIQTLREFGIDTIIQYKQAAYDRYLKR